MEKPSIPETSAHLLPLSEAIVRYAAEVISFEEYNQILDIWWETHKEVWREGDLSLLFRLACALSI